MSQQAADRAEQLHTLINAGVDAVGGRQATQRT